MTLSRMYAWVSRTRCLNKSVDRTIYKPCLVQLLVPVWKVLLVHQAAVSVEASVSVPYLGCLVYACIFKRGYGMHAAVQPPCCLIVYGVGIRCCSCYVHVIVAGVVFVH